MNRVMGTSGDTKAIKITSFMIYDSLPFDHTHGTVRASLDALTGTDTLFIVNNDSKTLNDLCENNKMRLEFLFTYKIKIY